MVLVDGLIIGFFSRNLLVLSTATADRNVPKGASFGPIPSTGLAKVPRLREAVVVVVAEFCVC